MPFILGVWNAICDRCGFEFKSNKLREEWTGLMVCKQCHEPRHPQTLIKVPTDESSVPWSRPNDNGSDISPAYILIEDDFLSIDLETELGTPLISE